MQKRASLLGWLSVVIALSGAALVPKLADSGLTISAVMNASGMSVIGHEPSTDLQGGIAVNDIHDGRRPVQQSVALEAG